MNVAGEHAALEERLILLGSIGRIRPPPEPVLALLTKSGNRAPSWALAALAPQVRIRP
jgi:hypothetical protein